MKRSTMWMAVSALALTAGGVLVGRALATGAPTVTPLTYAGTVTDKDGKPYPTAVDVQVAFYDSLTATTAKCTAPLAKAEAGTGRFQVVLPVECVQAVHDVADLWSEAVVGPGKQVLPRVHVGAVPYALEADVASKAGGALKAEIEALKAGGGGGGGPWVVDANGTKLGQALQANRELQGNAGWTGQEELVFLTSTGYISSARLDSYRWDGIFGTSMFYSGKGCTGAAYMSVSQTLIPAFMNRRIFGYQGKFYGADGPKAGSSKSQGYQVQSVQPFGKDCADESNFIYGVPFKILSPAEVGLPVSFAAPLTVVP